MQDRPNYDELLAAVERFLDDEIVAKSEGSRRFHGRVAANVLRIVRRELAHDEEQLAREWAGLDELLGSATQPDRREDVRSSMAERNEALAERIRNGDADGGEFRQAVLAHVRRTVRDKLLVTNPGWLGEEETEG